MDTGEIFFLKIRIISLSRRKPIGPALRVAGPKKSFSPFWGGRGGPIKLTPLFGGVRNHPRKLLPKFQNANSKTLGVMSQKDKSQEKPKISLKLGPQNYDTYGDKQKKTHKKKFHLENRMWGPQNGY